MSEQDPRFPIGRFHRPATRLDAAVRASLIDEIEGLPTRLRALVQDLSDAQLDTSYRPGGWTVRQVVHHLPDSHMNAYVRFKMAITEDGPAIRPYLEARWAELPEARTAPVHISLDLLDALHRRWTLSLRNMSDIEWQRIYVHPEMGAFPLDAALALYAWHGAHHTAHVRQAPR